MACFLLEAFLKIAESKIIRKQSEIAHFYYILKYTYIWREKYSCKWMK